MSTAEQRESRAIAAEAAQARELAQRVSDGVQKRAHEEVKARREKEESPNFDPLLGEIPPELVELDGAPVEEETLPTLREVGKVLPIGFVDHTGTKHRDFELAEWDWEMEEKLGDLAEQNPDMPLNQYVSEVIGHAVKRIGSVDLSRMKRSQRRLLARSLYFSDALYLYVWIRIEALGHGLRLDRFKHRCGKWIDGFVGDLRTLEVKSYDEIPRRRVVLEHGVKYGGERRTVFVVGPIKWAFMEADDASVLKNSAKFKAETLRQGVVEIEGAPEGPVVLTTEHLRSMKPREINRLVEEIDQCNGGAVMEVAGDCPHCKEDFRYAIDWSYDDFFAPSSH